MDTNPEVRTFEDVTASLERYLPVPGTMPIRCARCTAVLPAKGARWPKTYACARCRVRKTVSERTEVRARRDAARTGRDFLLMPPDFEGFHRPTKSRPRGYVIALDEQATGKEKRHGPC